MRIQTNIFEIEIDDFNLFAGTNIQCKGGGGGSSGKVDFPDHMKTAHKDWLDNTGTDTMTSSIVDLMNAAMTGASPYNGYVPVDPDTAFFAAGNDLSNYRTPYEMLKCFDIWSIDDAFDTYMAADAAYITAAVAAQSTDMDDEINNNVLPRFKAGMANINAVMSSAFVIGEARIWDSKAKGVLKTDADIRLRRLKEGSDTSLERIKALTEWRRIVTSMSAEFARIYLAAYFERDESYLDKLAKDATWDMEMYQYGCQVMACISGTASTVTKVKSQSALGGALSGAMAGAATGAMVGGPVGAGIGGALGLAGSLF